MKIYPIIFFLFACSLLVAQQKLEPVGNSTNKFLNFTIDATFILNRTFSHYIYDKYPAGRYSGSTVQALPGKYKVVSGYSLGTTALLSKKKNKFIISVNISSTGGAYKSRSWSGSDTPIRPSIYRRETGQIDVNKRSIYFNVYLGYRIHLYRNFFIEPSIGGNANLATFEKQSGTMTTIEYSMYMPGDPNPKPTYYKETVTEFHNTVRYRDEGNRCAKVSLLYKFTYHNKEYLAYVFRHLASDTRLPWWGLGLSVCL